MQLRIPTTAEQDLADELAHLHLKTQIIRFLRLYAMVLVPMLMLPDAGAISWRTLAAAVPATAEALIRQMWPSLPVDDLLAALRRLGHIKADPAPAAPPSMTWNATVAAPPSATWTAASTAPASITFATVPAPRSPESEAPVADTAPATPAPIDTPTPAEEESHTAMTTAPAVGTPVLFTLSSGAAATINRRRQDYANHRAALVTETTGTADTGHIAHVGNHVEEGDACFGVVVRTFHPETTANLQVFLDGSDTYWATSVPEGEGPGTWAHYKA